MLKASQDSVGDDMVDEIPDLINRDIRQKEDKSKRRQMNRTFFAPKQESALDRVEDDMSVSDGPEI